MGIKREQTNLIQVLSGLEYSMKSFTMLLKSTGRLVRPDRVQVLLGVKKTVTVSDRCK